MSDNFDTSPRRPSRWIAAEAAHSVSFFVAIYIVLAVETVALHLWLSTKIPALAWTLTTLSVLSALWLWRDQRSQREHGLRIEAETWHVLMGSRARALIHVEHIAEAKVATWRDAPEPARDYLNAGQPHDPNLLITLTQPVTVRLPLGIRRRVSRLGLRLHRPEDALLDPATTSARLPDSRS